MCRRIWKVVEILIISFSLLSISCVQNAGKVEVTPPDTETETETESTTKKEEKGTSDTDSSTSDKETEKKTESNETAEKTEPSQKNDTTDTTQTSQTNGTSEASTKTDNTATNTVSNSESQTTPFFWGTWLRMDSGEKYEFYEDTINNGESSYLIYSYNDNTLTASGLGTFTKQSEHVIVNNNIPYFRNSGSNLEYSLKIVGFQDNSRTALNFNTIKGIKAVGKSNNYHSWKSESESNENGVIVLTAPTSSDLQTITLEKGDGSTIVVPGIQVINSGSYMGTVALVDDDQYSLKITGKIDESQTNNGYVFGNNAKTYPLKLTITNISENTCSSSICKIESKDSRLTVSSSEYNLQAFAISTMKPGGTKTLTVDVKYGDITEPFIDTGLDITVTNPKTGQEWVDYVPIRFYKGLVPVTVSAKSPENNNNAALNGFIIYPDGNSQFFTVNNNSSKILLVPFFGEQEKYEIVFSGATTSAQLSNSTEMFYSVSTCSNTSKDIDLSHCDASTLAGYMTFAGSNQTEDTAYEINDDFIAYLSDGEIDYYSFKANTNVLLYNPSATNFYLVSYESEYGDVPDSFYIIEGETIPSSRLPALTSPNQKFLGWYVGDHRVTDSCCCNYVYDYNYNYNYVYGHRVSSNIKLTAKWKPIGNAGISVTVQPQSDIEVSRTQSGNIITFSIPDGYTVLGWYLDGVSKGSDNTYSLNTSSLRKGTYILEVEAQKNGKYYSYTAHIKID